MPLLHTFGSTPFGGGAFLGGTATLPVPSSARVSADRYFLRGLVHTVSVEYDAAAGGGVVGPMGAAGPPDWRPVAGLGALACRIDRLVPGPTEGADRPGEMTEALALFGVELAAGRGHRLVRTDPAGVTRYYYLTGEVFAEEDGRGRFHHAVAPLRDRPL